jgi:hypothetical protein
MRFNPSAGSALRRHFDAIRFLISVNLRRKFMSKKMMGFLLLTCLVTLATAQPASAAASNWVLYDDFTSGIIDPTKWNGLEEGNSIGRETQRTATGGKLTLLERCYGYTNSNAGVPYEQQKLYFANGPNTKAIKATVKPVKFEAIGCADNTASTWAAARIMGYFFNTSLTSPTSGTNDVHALIGIFHDSSLNQDEDNATIKAMVRQCTDNNCNTANIMYEKTLGSIKIGQQAVLSMEWDHANHKFIFMLNKKIFSYKYNSASYPDNFPSYWKGKRLEASAQVANCIVTPEMQRPTGLMQATFDDVYIKTLSQ